MPDADGSSMPIDGPLDLALTRLFALDPPARLQRDMDRRVAAALDSPRRVAGSGPRVSRRGVALLLAATLVLGGATGLYGLYTTMGGPFADAFGLIWQRGVELDVSQTVDGYRVSLDRAYLDANRLVLAIRVVDERERAGTSELMALSARVTDASGEYRGLLAQGQPIGRWAATNIVYKEAPAVPLPSGLRRLHVVIPFVWVRADVGPEPVRPRDATEEWPWQRHPGPWAFDIEVPVDGGGTLLAAQAPAITNGIRVDVPRMVVTPSMIRLEVRVEGPSGPGGWVHGELTKDGQTFPIVGGTIGDPEHLVLLTSVGTDDPSGIWTFRVTEVTVHDEAGGDERSVPGDWTLTFVAP